MAFLVGTLVLQSGEEYNGEIPPEVVQAIQDAANNRTQVDGKSETLLEGLRREGVLSGLLGSLRDVTEDVEFEENAMRALGAALEKGGLSDGEKVELRSIWERWGEAGREERGLSGEEAASINRLLA